MKKFFQKIRNDIVDDLKNDSFSRMLYAGLPFVVIAFVLWKFGHYFEARLGITLAVVEIPIFMFGAFLASRILREAREEAKEVKRLQDQEKHIKDMSRIYSKLITMQIQIVGNKLELQVERFDNWEPWHKELSIEGLFVSLKQLEKLEHPYYEFAISHLEAYEGLHAIFQAFITKIGQMSFESHDLETLQKEKDEYNASQELYSFREYLTKLVKEINAGIPLRGTCRVGF